MADFLRLAPLPAQTQTFSQKVGGCHFKLYSLFKALFEANC